MAVNRVLSDGDVLYTLSNGRLVRVSTEEIPPIRLRDLYSQMGLAFDPNTNYSYEICNSFFEQNGNFVPFRFMLFSLEGPFPNPLYFVRVFDESLSLAENLEGLWLSCTYA